MQNYRDPKDNGKFRWTAHVGRKMRFYGLTPSRVIRVVNAPQRVEEGVAPGTVAGMQKAGSGKKPWEVWAMWRTEGAALGSKKSEVRMTKSNSDTSAFAIRTSPFRRKVIITAWRYPGTSPVRGAVPLPVGVLAELEAEGEL
jgi:hypothetical protein